MWRRVVKIAAASVGKANYRTLRASFRKKKAGAAARVMENEPVEPLGRRFETRDDGPLSVFHAEPRERARGQAVRDALLAPGIEPGRIAVSAPARNAARDNRGGSTMSLDARPAAISGAAA